MSKSYVKKNWENLIANNCPISECERALITSFGHRLRCEECGFEIGEEEAERIINNLKNNF